MGHVQARGRLAGQYSDEQVKGIMLAPKIVEKFFKDESYRIFMIAVLASLLWHLFWLSTITIVAKPENARAVKFSRVSFLGPLLGGGSMEFQARPKERSFLEKRYLDAAGRLSKEPAAGANKAIEAYEEGSGASHGRDERMTSAIDDALAGDKILAP